jgi:hypothetical protein
MAKIYFDIIVSGRFGMGLLSHYGGSALLPRNSFRLILVTQPPAATRTAKWGKSCGPIRLKAPCSRADTDRGLAMPG